MIPKKPSKRLDEAARVARDARQRGVSSTHRAATQTQWGTIAESHTELRAAFAEPSSAGHAAPDSASGSADPLYDAMLVRAERLLNERDESVASQLNRLAEESGAWPKLATVYRNLAGRPLSLGQQVEVRFRLGTLYADRLNEPERALRTLQRVLDLQPGHVRACIAVEALLARFERWQDLANLLEYECRAGAGDRAVTVRLSLARILEERLGQPEAAANTYELVLKLEPDQVEAVAQLERLYRAGLASPGAADLIEPFLETRGEWRRLAVLLEYRLAAADSTDERVALQMRIASTYEQRLNDPTRALETWTRSLLEHPKAEKAADEIERIASATGAWQVVADSFQELLTGAKLEPERRQSFLRRLGAALKRAGRYEDAVARYREALAIDRTDERSLEELCELFERLERHFQLVETLRRRIELTFVWDVAEPLWLRIAEIQESKLSDLDAASECCLRVLEFSRSNERAFACLDRIYRAQERWAELLDLYEMRVAVSDESERANLLLQMVRIATDRVRDDARALDLWDRIFALRPAREVEWAAVAAIHERNENWIALVGALEKSMPLISSERRRLQLYMQIASIKESKLLDFQGAIHVCEHVQALDQGNLHSLRSLARLYHLTASWGSFADTVWKIVRMPRDDDAIPAQQLVADLSELARVADEHLSDSSMAIDACRELLAFAPGHVSSLQRITRLLLREQRWSECVEMLELQASVESELPTRVDALREAALLCEEHLDDRQRACRLWERIQSFAPTHAQADAKLEHMHRQALAWGRLAALLAHRARHRPGDPNAPGWLAEAAELYEHALDDSSSAYGVLTLVLDARCDYEPRCDDLERLAERLGTWADLVARYRKLAQGVQQEALEASRCAALWLRIGRICADRLAQKREALVAVQSAATLMPDSIDVQDILVELLREQRRWPELVAELRTQVERAHDPERKQLLRWQLAELVETRMADPAAALTVYREIVACDPDSIDAMDKLERICRRVLDWAGLVEVLQRRIVLASKPEEQLEMQLEQARIWSTRLRDSDKAAEAYEAALALDPLCLEAIRVLSDRCRKNDMPQRHVELLELEALVVDNDRARFTIYQRMADVLETKCGDDVRAAACLEKAIGFEPNNLDSYRRLERCYGRIENWSALVDAYRRHLAILNNKAVWAEVSRAMANVYEEKLGDPRAALAVYESILRETEDSRAATRAIKLRAVLAESPQDGGIPR